MEINDGVTVKQLRSLIGRKGTVKHVGMTSKATVRSIVIEEKGIKLVLDAYNRTVKRNPSQFKPEDKD